MFKLIDVFVAFIIVGVLVLAGRSIRKRVRFFQALYLPDSIVAGGLALLLGPGVLGAIAGDASPFAQGVFPEAVQQVWKQSPGIFINLVFATLFLGDQIPSPRDIWRQASPQVAFGQVLAWGQYVVGILLTLLVLTPIFKVHPSAGALIEVGFEGGHGTAAAMQATFKDIGFDSGGDLALALATVGIVSGIIIGTLLISWGKFTGRVKVADAEAIQLTPAELERELDLDMEEAPEIRVTRAKMMREMLIDPLSLNFGLVGLAIVIGWFIQQGLVWVERLVFNVGDKGGLLSHIPLFPMTVIGGIIVQIWLLRTNRSYLISRPLIKRIGGVALDVTVVTALATISLSAIGANLPAFIGLSLIGITWNLFAFLVLAPRIIPNFWFERGIGDVGQSMGVTSTGLLLLRMVDPANQSAALESFAYKQLLFEPIVGGGLFTAIAPILINRFGPIATLALTGGLLAFWLIFGFYNFKRIRRSF